MPIIDDPPPVDPVDPPPDLAPPPPPATEDAFIEDHPSPASPCAGDSTGRRGIPCDTDSAAPARMQMGAAKVLAINAPRPEYPYEARRQRAIGSGVAR